jgi:hypothetical protein
MYFLNFIIKATNFGKNLLKIKCVLRALPQILTEKFPNLKIIQRAVFINVRTSSSREPVIFVRLSFKLEFCQHLFEKYTNIKFHENPSSENLVVLRGWKEGRTKRQT